LGVYLHSDEERISRDTYESRTKDTTGANCTDGGTQHVSDLRGAASRRCSCVPKRGFQVPSALFFKTEASNGAVAKQFFFSYSPDLDSAHHFETFREKGFRPAPAQASHSPSESNLLRISMLLGFFGLRARNCSSSLLIRFQFLFMLPVLDEGFESALSSPAPMSRSTTVPDRQKSRRTIDFRLMFPYHGSVRKWLPYSIWIRPLPERGSHQCGPYSSTLVLSATGYRAPGLCT
jgi:hypothetical protein